MNSEKTKEIKKALECCANLNGKSSCKDCPIGKKCYEDENLMPRLALTLINDLESENKELKKYRCDWLNSEKMHLQADMEDTEFELASSNRMLEEVNKENAKLKDRIAELEEEKARLEKVVKHFQELIEDGKLISSEQLKQFAERLKENLEEYRLENEYFTEHEPNGNLWQMNSSVFCIEVTQEGGLVDETLKEFEL